MRRRRPSRSALAAARAAQAPALGARDLEAGGDPLAVRGEAEGAADPGAVMTVALSNAAGRLQRSGVGSEQAADAALAAVAALLVATYGRRGAAQRLAVLAADVSRSAQTAHGRAN